MGALTATQANVQSESGSDAEMRLNANVIIFCAAGALAVATAIECQSLTHLPSLLYGAVLWGWWGCIASALWRRAREAPLSPIVSARAVATQLLVGSALGLTHLVLLASLGFTAAGWHAHATAVSVLTSMLDLNRFGMELLLYGFLLGITLVVRFQLRAQHDTITALELQRQLSAAHLRTLQMQLEPHFLFNTLKAITTLVELDRSKQAAEMLRHLNSILKGTLKRTTPEKVPLSQELEMMENYLAIEQVRFADRLRVEIKVEPGALNGLVPCFLLQPIVENAIRHGISHCENQGLVQASVRRDGPSLRLCVRDSGTSQKRAPQPGHGIGLRNTRERLAHFYQDNYAMTAEPLEFGGFEVAITIPYERNAL